MNLIMNTEHPYCVYFMRCLKVIYQVSTKQNLKLLDEVLGIVFISLLFVHKLLSVMVMCLSCI